MIRQVYYVVGPLFKWEKIGGKAVFFSSFWNDEIGKNPVLKKKNV